MATSLVTLRSYSGALRQVEEPISYNLTANLRAVVQQIAAMKTLLKRTAWPHRTSAQFSCTLEIVVTMAAMTAKLAARNRKHVP